MDIHKNARLTPASRALLVNRVVNEAWPMAAAAIAAGVSDRTGWKWLRRYREEGSEGLHDRSSRPHRVRRTGVSRKKRIVRLRRARLTCRQIAGKVKRSVATVARVVKAAGLARLKSLDPPAAARRYKRAAPGDMIHIDIKRLARIEESAIASRASERVGTDASAMSSCTSASMIARA